MHEVLFYLMASAMFLYKQKMSEGGEKVKVKEKSLNVRKK